MLPLIDDDLLTIRSRKISDKLFAHRLLPIGKLVSVRLNLNHKIEKDNQSYFIQSIHEGSTPYGKIIGYDKAITLINIKFYVNEKARATIAAGHHKFSMAAVTGQLTHDEPSLKGIAIRFNPKNTQYFQRVDNNAVVVAAEEATIFNNRVYIRGNFQ